MAREAVRAAKDMLAAEDCTVARLRNCDCTIPAGTNLPARWSSDEDVDEATILEADSQLKAQMAGALVHRTNMLSVPKAFRS